MKIRSCAAILLVTACAAARAQTAPATQPAPRPAGGRLVFQDDFTNLSHWTAEGPHKVEARDGRLHVTTVQDDRQVGQYVWCKHELPADFRLEFDVTPLSRSGFFLIFFCVQGTSGEDVLGNELFDDYMNWKTWQPYDDWDKYTSAPQRQAHHQSRIRGYHVSYRRNEQANCNLRKNPGLVLKKSSDVDALLPQGKTAHVVLTKQAGRIVLTVDGKLFMDWTDADNIYSGGRFGLRNVYDADAEYDNVKLHDLR